MDYYVTNKKKERERERIRPRPVPGDYEGLPQVFLSEK